ncbi:MAG: helix-turn-helix domain-containing protein [Acidimicrobiales bacterium]|nr:helix-turn-helix domain-containing protein [Acidimicrobiales bacterium]
MAADQRRVMLPDSAVEQGGAGGIVAVPMTVGSNGSALLHAREVAEILRIRDDAVLDLIHRDELAALRVSPRIIRIPVAGFDAWRGHPD